MDLVFPSELGGVDRVCVARFQYSSKWSVLGCLASLMLTDARNPLSNPSHQV